jgi:cytosine/adenosine deaminase-related metal-dependent hydrolase
MSDKTLLLKNADILCTMAEPDGCVNNAKAEIKNGGLFARNGIIEAVAESNSLPETADTIIDMKGHVVIPGMVNTHHHLFQNLTRAVPAAQNSELFGWLKTLYPIWSNIRPEHVYWSTALGLAELALSGCTTSSDHLYIYPNGAKLDDSLSAAADIGVRFHGTRGSMSIGESQGGLPPDSLTEKESFILSESQRLIETYNDNSRYAMQRVALAPCSPFSVSIDLMRESAEMARSYGVGLHTHLAENIEDIEYGLHQFGMRPGEYIEAVGWTGDDVWHAHCVQLNSEEIKLFAKTGTGIAHCPCSNMRLASGIAPVRQMLDTGVKVGLGVDGSASNDSGNMLNEVRQTMLLQRVNSKASAMTAREALRIATKGGASVLNRDDIGMLLPGYSADITAFKRDNVDFSGSDWDPVASLVFCGPSKANYTIINGKTVVSEGQLTTIPIEKLVHKHSKLSHDLINL